MYYKQRENTTKGVATISAEHLILQNLLKNLRKEANLSQQELAQRIGKPQSFVSKYEAGERRLDMIELRHICKALDLSLIDFILRLENMLTGETHAS